MFLKNNHIGAASKKEYGKAGDEVEVLNQRDNMVLVRINNHVFWINESGLIKARNDDFPQSEAMPLKTKETVKNKATANKKAVIVDIQTKLL